MIEDRQLRGLSERTQEMSIRAVRQLADHDHTSPARITAEELRASFLSLKHVQHASRRTSPLALCGITFFSEHTLKREWATLTVVRAPREKKLPVVLRVAAVRAVLAPLKLLRSRGCLTTISSWGRRLHEGPHLQVPDIDRARLRVPGRRGTGARARSGPLPPRTLALLR